MAYMTRIVDDLKSFGLKVETVSGWQTRGSSYFSPKGVVDHWTAGPRNSTTRPSLRIVTYGRSDLPGPLCNVYLDRRGICVVVAAGRANHAGSGGWKGLSGNSSVYGIEAECGGDGDWTSAQRAVYPVLNAALLSGIGRDESYVCGHNEWAPTRKIDIRDWPMSQMRTQTRVHLNKGDDVSRQDAFLGTYDALKSGAERSDPTGRQIGDNLQQIVVPSIRAGIRADLTPILNNMATAIAKVSGGETFDEAKLRAGVQESARLGVLSGAQEVANAAAAAVTKRLEDVEGVDEKVVAEEVVQLILARLAE